MTDYKNKDDNFKKLTRPIFAYITFRSDIAFHSVLELDKKEKEVRLSKSDQLISY